MANHDIPSPKEEYFDKKYQQHLKKETQKKQMQGAKKNFKRNHQPRQTRQKKWMPDNLDDWDELDYDLEERMMPRGESERRRTLARTMLRPEKSEERGQVPVPDNQRQHGLVVEVSKGICQVDLGDRILPCQIRGVLKAEETGFTTPVAVGDEVIVHKNETESGIVEAVLPRRSMLVRPDVFYHHLQQVIVANAGQLLVVASWREPTLWLELVDRYLITAERNNLPAVICINKIDLAEDEAILQATLQPYRDLGYQIILTSALTGSGIDHLQTLLRNQTTVLSGLSGVGKSSLLNAIQPGLQLRTGDISTYHGDGQHTTSQATLIRLDADSAVIDTPGIREFGLSGMARQELAQYFPEFAAVTNCRFADCAHLNEPDCAVHLAVSRGYIAASRYHSYKQIYASL